MTGYFLFGMIALALICCKGKDGSSSEKENTIPDHLYDKILTYGLPNTERQILSDGISEKWKILQVDVAGCEVTQKLMDSVAAENSRTYANLESKYGRDWKERYERDLQDFAMKRVDVMDVLITNKIFRDKLKQCNIEIDGVDKDIIQSRTPGIYEAAVYSFDEDFNRKNCCKVRVDINKRTVTLIQ